MSDGILVPSQSSRQGDKIKILSGGSQSQRAVDLIKTLQYSGCTSLKILENIKYELNECNKRRAVCVYMHMPGTNIHTPGLPHSVIPILPEKPVSNIIYLAKKDTMLVDHSYHCYLPTPTLQTKYKVNH